MNVFKHEIINDIVIIDGLSRSGKFYLGKIISGIQGLEYFIPNSEAERIIQINEAGTLTDHDAASLLTVAINEAIYSMAIGRNINMRFDDGSSILNSFEKDLYLRRQNIGSSGDNGLKTVTDNKRSSVIMLHQSLRTIDMIKSSMPKSKIINLRRHPIDLVYSWIKRGWGSRYGSDSLSFDAVYEHEKGLVPYYAKEWAEDYLSSNDYEKVIKSIVYMTEEESAVITSKQYDICCVYYDNLIEEPMHEVSKICTFLNRLPHASIYKTVETERRDTSFLSQREMKMKYISSGIQDKILFKKFVNLGMIYEENINKESE